MSRSCCPLQSVTCPLHDQISFPDEGVYNITLDEASPDRIMQEVPLEPQATYCIFKYKIGDNLSYKTIDWSIPRLYKQQLETTKTFTEKYRDNF
jgi:hypothetical protein